MSDPDAGRAESKSKHADIAASSAKDPQNEIVLIPPETEEEWELFKSLLDDIRTMYNFARDRGIDLPDRVIEGISRVLAFSNPTGWEDAERLVSKDEESQIAKKGSTLSDSPPRPTK